MLMLPALLAAIVPVRVATAPHIDGHLDDAAWTAVPASDSFTQSFPHDGAAPSDPTRVQVTYDDDNLYIAIDCAQHTPRLARLTRRDRDVDDDRISVDLDTAHDRRSAFHFQVSAAGVMVDGLRYQDTELNTDWDEIGDGRALERTGRLGLELSLRSDPHRAVSASMSLATRSTYNGSETYLNGVIALRPRDNLAQATRADADLKPS